MYEMTKIDLLKHIQMVESYIEDKGFSTDDINEGLSYFFGWYEADISDFDTFRDLEKRKLRKIERVMVKMLDRIARGFGKEAVTDVDFFDEVADISKKARIKFSSARERKCLEEEEEPMDKSKDIEWKGVAPPSILFDGSLATEGKWKAGEGYAQIDYNENRRYLRVGLFDGRGNNILTREGQHFDDLEEEIADAKVFVESRL